MNITVILSIAGLVFVILALMMYSAIQYHKVTLQVEAMRRSFEYERQRDKCMVCEDYNTCEEEQKIILANSERKH